MATELLTAEDYFRLTPPDSLEWELLGGVLVVSPRPTVRHQRLVVRLLESLLELQRRGLGEVLLEVDNVLSEHDVLGPDLLFVRADRSSIVGEQAVVGPADLAIEVLSPRTRSRDLKDKRRIDAQAGVLSYWTVDPVDDHIAVRRLRRRSYGRATMFRPPRVLELDDFPGLAIDLARLFARP